MKDGTGGAKYLTEFNEGNASLQTKAIDGSRNGGHILCNKTTLHKTHCAGLEVVRLG